MDGERAMEPEQEMERATEQGMDTASDAASDAVESAERDAAAARPAGPAANPPHQLRHARKSRAQRATSSATSGASDGWIAVGEIAGAFGVQGEIKVRLLTDFPERFSRVKTLYLGDERTPYTVGEARTHANMALLTFKEVQNANEAARLRGTTIYIPATEIMPLDEGQFYLHDVIGAQVRHVNGRPLGVVTDVLSAGGQDVFVVQRDGGAAEALVPVVKEFVKAIDLARREVVVDPIPGLFDEQFEEAE